MDFEGGKLKNAGGGVQLFVLLALWYFGIVLAASILHMMFDGDFSSSAYSIRFSYMLQGAFLFLIPSTIYIILFAGGKGAHLARSPLVIKTLLLAILAIFCIQPFVETVNHYNDLIALPESMGGMTQFFEESKQSTTKTLKLVFADKTIPSLLINIFVIAVLPGILEELFFRGCMQRSIYKIAKNPHVAIWITALIFSLLHFQLAGFFPRIILGALLGYLYLWTKNLWVPIIVHTIHNATIVIIAQMFAENETYKKISLTNYSLSNAGIYAAISFVLTAGIIYLIYSMRAEKKNTENQ